MFSSHFRSMGSNFSNRLGGMIRSELPVDRRLTVCFQKFIALAEMSAAEKSSVCGQRARMRRLQHQMARIGHHDRLALGRRTPQHIYDRPVLLLHCLNDRIGKLLPAVSLVGVGLMGAHGQHRVEQKDTLLRPTFYDSGAFDLIVLPTDSMLPAIKTSCEDIAMTALANAIYASTVVLRYRKAQAVRLVHVVIGILSQDHHLHFAQRRQMKRIEDLIRRRVYGVLRIFLSDKAIEIPVIGFGEFRLHGGQPVT